MVIPIKATINIKALLNSEIFGFPFFVVESAEDLTARSCTSSSKLETCLLTSCQQLYAIHFNAAILKIV
jgi:hypothetical protein